MTDPTRPRATVSTNATTTLRPSPSELLMIARVRVAAATLDIGLAEVTQQANDSVRRLTRLGATRAWAGVPHSDEQADLDPIAGQMRATRRIATADTEERPGVNIAVAAIWNIAGLTADRVMSLVDRLRFDAAADVEPTAPPASPPSWDDPMQHIQKMMARAIEMPNDRSARFLYLARVTDDQLTQAAAEAYRSARRQAERLATAAGRTVGEVTSLSYGHNSSGSRPDHIMSQQRCVALLAAVGYVLQEGEAATEDPRAIEVSVSIHTTHQLESR